jgi:putative transferase (TIGR04331 family)
MNQLNIDSYIEACNNNPISVDPSYVKSLYVEILNNFSKELNSIHRSEITLNQWETIFGWWLLELIVGLNDRWERISYLSKNQDSITLHVCERADDFNPRYTALNEHPIDSSHELNSYIYEKMAKYFERVNIQRDQFSKFESLSHKSSQIQNYVYKRIFNLTKKLKFIKNQELYLISDWIPFKHRLRLTIKSRSPVFLDRFNKVLFRILESQPVRSSSDLKTPKLSSFNPSNPFEDFLKDELPRFVPRCLIENFDGIRIQLIEAQLDFHPTMTLVNTAHIGGSDKLLIWLGLYGNSRNQLHIFQHGGGYGHFSLWWASYFEERICKIFFAWGWAPTTSKSLQNAAAVRLQIENPQKKYLTNSPRSDILFILTQEMTYPVPLLAHFQPHDIFSHLRVLEDIKEIITSLRNESNSETLLQCVSDKLEITSQFFHTNTVSNIKIVTKKTVKLEKVKVIVSTYIGTNSSESLLRGIPTLFFMDSKYCNFTEDAKLIFEDLKNVGIFHQNRDSLRRMLDMSDLELLNWWNMPNVKVAVQSYLNRFALPESNENQWADKIIEYNDEIL